MVQTTTIAGIFDLMVNPNPHRRKQNLNDAVQIQYLVRMNDIGVVEVQGYNIWRSEESKAPRRFHSAIFPHLKLITSQQWVLALLWECQRKERTLSSDAMHLLSGYLLYIERILDKVMGPGGAENEVILKDWVRVEEYHSGNHTLEVVPEHQAGALNVHNRKAVEAFAIKRLQEWEMGEVYRGAPDMLHSLSREKKDMIFLKATEWLEACTRSLPPRTQIQPPVPSIAGPDPLTVAAQKRRRDEATPDTISTSRKRQKQTRASSRSSCESMPRLTLRYTPSP